MKTEELFKELQHAIDVNLSDSAFCLNQAAQYTSALNSLLKTRHFARTVVGTTNLEARIAELESSLGDLVRCLEEIRAR